MLEKLAWRILARRMERYIKAGKHHHADHIRAAIATKPQKQCSLCCILENTDWLAWATRFDLVNVEKDAEMYRSSITDGPLL